MGYDRIAKTSVCKGYVLCPGRDCNKRVMVNSDDEIVDCKNCGTISNISFLELHPLLNSENMNQQSAMKELKGQQEKIVKAENTKKPVIDAPEVRNISKLNETPIKQKNISSDDSSTT